MFRVSSFMKNWRNCPTQLQLCYLGQKWSYSSYGEKGNIRAKYLFWEKFIFVGLIKSKKRSSVSFSSLSSIRIEKFESSQSQLWLSGPFLPSAQTFPSRCLRGSWNFHFAPFSKKKKSNHFSHMFLIKRLSSLSSWRARDFFNNFIQKGTFWRQLLWTLAYPDAIPKH